ncbi:NAD(P)-binding protein [Atractiella rhizophila]|nr:NAD(P)-binding protein [Atractiella rhizophila]
MARVLVTGANGFVGIHVVDRLLQSGFSVRGTVRSVSKSGAYLERKFSEFSKDKRFEVVEAADLLYGDLSSIVRGCSLIAHVASPYHFQTKDNERDMLLPAIDATTNVLKYAKQEAVKRVVVTSSCAAVFDAKQGGCWRDYTYTDKDWNSTTYAEAKASTLPVAVYAASKKFAEQAAWDFASSNNMELVTINPPMIYGPALQDISSPEALNTSSANIYNLLTSSSRSAPLPEDRLPLLSDVRDVAEAHVRAFQVPEAKGHRFIVSNGAILWRDLVKQLGDQRPELKDRLPNIPSDLKPENRTLSRLDSTPAREVLGLKFTGVMKTFNDSIDELLEREKKGWTD